MDALLTQTTVYIREIQHDLLTYENARDREADVACQNLINNKFQQLLDTCDRLDILVNKEPAQRRAQSRQRVNEIKYDIKHYQVRRRSSHKAIVAKAFLCHLAINRLFLT
jgi:golgi SNAP receptor complex member 2